MVVRLSVPNDVRQLNATTLETALDEFSITDDWSIAKDVRDGGTLGVHEARNNPSQAFQNLIVGRIAEVVYREEHLQPLEVAGFSIDDLHERGENRDFAVRKDGLELPINVKTASTIFRKAKEIVGLEPNDCIPIPAYKAVAVSERVPDLVYVDLVDFSFRQRVDEFTDSLRGSAGYLWKVLSWYGGKGVRKAQDGYVAKLFDLHEQKLMSLAPKTSSWRVISAQRVLAIMRDKPRRCPGLGVRAAGTGGFNAEVNIHVSANDETVSWQDVSEALQRSGIQAVLDMIRHRTTREVADPSL